MFSFSLLKAMKARACYYTVLGYLSELSDFFDVIPAKAGIQSI
jgi:hypothetical protein